MKYQLILQWPKSSVAQYDALIEIEDLLIENLSDRSQVDGHDMGAGEANIFILTDNPEASFGEVRAILSKTPIWRVAHPSLQETFLGGLLFAVCAKGGRLYAFSLFC